MDFHCGSTCAQPTQLQCISRYMSNSCGGCSGTIKDPWKSNPPNRWAPLRSSSTIMLCMITQVVITFHIMFRIHVLAGCWTKTQRSCRIPNAYFTSFLQASCFLHNKLPSDSEVQRLSSQILTMHDKYHCKVVPFCVGVAVDLKVALQCLTFNKHGENRRALQHIYIILRTFHAEERMSYLEILRRHFLKNDCATINMPFILPCEANR
jgi:hypothetical protein